MQSKSLILLILALGCGVVASIGITQVMANRSSSPPPATVETVPVFVVKADIPLGNQLTAEKLKLEQWPKDKVPEGILGKLEDIEGRRPKTKLFAGEPVLDVKLLGKGESDSGAAIQIPIGYRSVPVRVDEVSGGAAMILPGDRVDVLVYAKAGCEVAQTLTKTILQDIRVFAVDSTWTLESDESGKTIRGKTISLLLTPEQTERMMLAAELGKIRLALRSPNDHDEAEVPDSGHRVGHVLGDADVADREKDSTLMPEKREQPIPPIAFTPPEVPSRPSHTVRIISGSTVEQVTMEGTAEASALSVGEPGETTKSSPSLFWQIMSAPASPDQAGSQQTPAGGQKALPFGGKAGSEPAPNRGANGDANAATNPFLDPDSADPPIEPEIPQTSDER